MTSKNDKKSDTFEAEAEEERAWKKKVEKVKNAHKHLVSKNLVIHDIFGLFFRLKDD